MFKFFFVFLIFASSVLAAELPSGWEIPSQNDLYAEKRDGLTGLDKTFEDAYVKHQHEFRKINPQLFIKGNFNGNGIVDEALFAVHSSSDEYTIFVYLDNSSIPINLFNKQKLSKKGLKDLALVKVVSSQFRSQCEKAKAGCLKHGGFFGFDCPMMYNSCTEKTTLLTKLKSDAIWLKPNDDIVMDAKSGSVSFYPYDSQSLYYWDNNSKDFKRINIARTATIEEELP